MPSAQVNGERRPKLDFFSSPSKGALSSKWLWIIHSEKRSNEMNDDFLKSSWAMTRFLPDGGEGIFPKMDFSSRHTEKAIENHRCMGH